MSKRKKIILVSVLSLVALFLLFVGYHYVRYLKATSRMQVLSADLEKRISEWEKKEYKRQPLFGKSIPGNAAEYYKKAMADYLALEKENMPNRDAKHELSDQIYNAFEKPDQPISPELKTYLELIQPVFNEYMNGANAETYKPLIDWRGESWNISTTGYGAIRTVVKLMVIQSRESAKDNQASESLKLCCAFIRAGDDTARRGAFVDGLVGIALSSMSQSELLRLLDNTELSEPQMTELTAALKALIDSEISFTGLCESEQLYIEAFLKQLSRTHGLVPRDNEIGLGPSFINRTDIVDAWEEVISGLVSLKNVNSMTYSQASKEFDKLDQTADLLENPNISQILLSGIASIHKKYYMLKAQRRGLYILAALKLYQSRHRKYPEKLSDLTPDIIKDVPTGGSALPLDPFTDQPFIYKVNPNGTILLYSVGINLKDDNGTADKRETDIVIAPYLRGQERK